MPFKFGEGSASQGSEMEHLLNNMLKGMGDFIAQEQGTLAWVEGLVCARMLAGGLEFFRLMGKQLEPATTTIYLERWQAIYNENDTDINSLNYFKTVESLIGTPPNLGNVVAYLQKTLPQTYVDLRFIFETQSLATRGPVVNGTVYYPLSVLYVHQFQPRDKNDNKLMTDAQFQFQSNSYKRIVRAWIPGYATAENMVFYNTGDDGYANTITVAAGSKNVVGTATTFTVDFKAVTSNGYHQYFDVIDDLGNLETLTVASVTNDTHLVLVTPAANNITGRVYRTFGVRCDVMPSCDQALFNI